MRKLLLTAFLFCFWPAFSASADEVRSTFTRISDGPDGRARALQLAIVSYARAGASNGVRVDLVGAVHIGEKSYYESLNQQFQTYDALLYELIAPEGAVITPDMRPTGMVSGMQRAMTAMMDLSFQLEEVDYTQPNFVHADLSPDEMLQSMAERDESLYVYFWRLIYASLREYGRDPLGMRNMDAISGSVTSESQAHPLKIMMANEFASLDRMQNLLGNDAESAVIGARNERAIEVLQREILHGAKHLGIFYGVAHMRDLENRMLAIGFVPVETNWIDAWRL